jgi:hypothetical protein
MQDKQSEDAASPDATPAVILNIANDANDGRSKDC